MDFGIYTINFDAILDYVANRSKIALVLDIIFSIGWIPLVFLLAYSGLFLWVEYKARKATKEWKWVLLAIDIPAVNVQTPKAVEQMFSHLAGALAPPNLAEKYWHGHRQRYFSFEIISIEGYIQFLIYTEQALRDLVEASIYAQYPEAEIIEVEDYVTGIPDYYPNETHDIWAADFGLAAEDAYPIRSYREFEHAISKDTVLKDPMGTFLESFTRIGPGEQMWFQILVEPVSSSWKEAAIKKIKEIVGDSSIGKKGGNDLVFQALELPMKALEVVGDQVLGREPSESSSIKEKEGPPNKVQYLTPGLKKIVELMEDKIAKIGFKTKIRAVYVARKEVFKPTRGVQALIGAINQFNIPSANSIVPKYGVITFYFLKKLRASERKHNLMTAYKKRKIKAGANPSILNIEELASIWHFPMSHVKTPLLQKSLTKKTEPPAGLPIEVVVAPEEKPKEPPTGKKFVTDAPDVGYAPHQKFG